MTPLGGTGFTHRPRRLVLALLMTYGYRLGAAWLLALPVVQVVRASGIPRFPGGDRRLFESGGMYLLEVLAREHPALLASLPSTLGLLLLASFMGLLPQWLTLRALCPDLPDEPLSRAASRALPRLVALGALTWLVRAALLVASIALAFTARSYFTSARDERLPDLAFLGAAGFGVFAQLALSVWHDVASAAVVERDVGAVRASTLALGAIRRRLSYLCINFGATALASLGILVGCAMFVAELDVARTGAWRSWLGLAAHQLALLVALLVRTYWLACAVRAVVTPRRMPEERVAGWRPTRRRSCTP